MKFIDQFYFLFKSKSNTNFSNLCDMAVNNLESLRNELSRMPYEEIVSFQLYAENRNAMGASNWAQGELRRREFLCNKITIFISLLAFFVSMVALFNKF